MLTYGEPGSGMQRDLMRSNERIVRQVHHLLGKSNPALQQFARWAFRLIMFLSVCFKLPAGPR